MKPYKDVLTGLIFSMHSRRFLASLVASAVAWAGWKYGIPYEVQAVIQAPIVAFIVGESYADGKARENSGTVNVGNAETVTQGGSTPVAGSLINSVLAGVEGSTPVTLPRPVAAFDSEIAALDINNRNADWIDSDGNEPLPLTRDVTL